MSGSPMAGLQTDKESQYSHLLEDHNSSDDLDTIHCQKPTSHFWWKGCALWMLNLLLLCISLASMVVTMYYYRRMESVNYRIQSINPYAPLLQRLDLTLHPQTMNGSLWNEPYSVFRGDPSPEVNAAWDRVTDVRWFTISSEEVLRLGKDPTRTVKAPESWRQGPDAHLAGLDGQHALHCLEAVRRFAYFDYFYGPEFGTFANASEIMKVHLSHCLNIVLQSLMCQPSMGTFTFDWVETQTHPIPDFFLERKCVDHNAILDWQTKNSVADGQRWHSIAPPDGAWIYPASPALLAWEASLEGK